ncbi:MAG: hypothetical protein A2365_02045 [Candidatus Nealsonbacteria bacterium RIFOXYB1_FULL_40_15]|uniref:Uncharacterized protein n=2 Tax=Candidatus Nealsoniibacteriota TaxID=1817911 RepID=A0A1G2ERR2_9BACT|nr:MAG: hypothetical protein A2365_02045 [Candidatus Nealsonbacteria bacterium RIFOXYB1_FULL_40_15]OGZ28222.1 MAG: hypothetical protein A2427_02615 [Candidatus Nealsonbacteria bacterium RIFOXYC1_FULL_40_7]OGZ28988.1 MAG: hypothetical protein A2562_01770 [Candidatus Nealsonbacteria bacterium RIFOXYD1_FULL_39_11]
MDIILFIGGLVLLFKNEVKISKKKVLKGSKVKLLGLLCVLPFALGFVGGFIVSAGVITLPTLYWITTPLMWIAILATLYFILFYKEKTLA